MGACRNLLSGAFPAKGVSYGQSSETDFAQEKVTFHANNSASHSHSGWLVLK